jgi:universal stress protein E
MSFFDQIVVGLEYHPEESPEQAAQALHLQRASQLADASQLPVKVVTVLPAVKAGWFESDEAARARYDSAHTAVTEWVQQVGKELGEKFQTQVASGQAWMELMRAAGADSRTLIICATRRRMAFSRVLFGSTGMKLLRYAPGPVWLVHPNPDGDGTLDILASSDLTPVGQQVIEVAVSLAHLLPSRLHAITIAETAVENHILRHDMDPEEREKLYEKARSQSELRLQEQVSQTDYRILESGVQTHATSGDADACILQAVDNLKANLVVMATRARGGVAGMMLGNTAERLLTALPCSVLVIKPDDFKCPVEL